MLDKRVHKEPRDLLEHQAFEVTLVQLDLLVSQVSKVLREHLATLEQLDQLVTKVLQVLQVHQGLLDCQDQPVE